MYIKTPDGKIWALNPITEVKHNVTAAQWAVLSQFTHALLDVTDAQAALFTTV